MEQVKAFSAPIRIKTKAHQLLVQVPLATSAQTQPAVPRLGGRGRETHLVVVEPRLDQLEVSLEAVVLLVAVGTPIHPQRHHLELEQVIHSADRFSQVCMRPTPADSADLIQNQKITQEIQILRQLQGLQGQHPGAACSQAQVRTKVLLGRRRDKAYLAIPPAAQMQGAALDVRTNQI